MKHALEATRVRDTLPGSMTSNALLGPRVLWTIARTSTVTVETARLEITWGS